MNLDRGIYNEVQMNLLKSTINNVGGSRISNPDLNKRRQL